MTILSGLENLQQRYRRPVVTIGNFDGVHLGHQALFAVAVRRARIIKGSTIAMTFEPHPMRVLRPAVNLPLITPLEQKLKLILACGIDVVVCARFDEDFAQLSADDFVEKLLIGRMGMAEVVIGHDFTFGRRGLGDADLLRAKAAELGFEVHEVGPVLVEGGAVSSTRVRQVVKDCDMAAARHLLGRHYQVAGRVVAGHGRGGKLLGFPTANLKVVDELLPGPGVYAVLVEREGGDKVMGVNNIGSNPTFEDGGLNVETHLLDFAGDLYGEEIILHFVEHLRPEKRFSSPEELAAQIGRDVEQARQSLGPWLQGERDILRD